MNEIPKIESEEKVEALDFEDFSFSDVDVFKDDLDPHKAYIEKKEVRYENADLEFEFWHLPAENSLEDFNVCINKDGQRAIRMTMNFRKLDNGPEVISRLKKNCAFQNDPELKGLGIQLYERMLDFFQDIANRRGAKFTHVIEKGPNFYKKNEKSGSYIELDPAEADEIWDKIFQKLLVAHGYQKIEEKKWSKEYRPNISYAEMNDLQGEKLNEKRKKEEEEFQKRTEERLEKLRQMADDGNLFIDE